MSWFSKKRPSEPAPKSAHEQAAEDMAAFEALDEVPRDPRDWPSGKQSYLTYGNAGDDRYGDGATAKIGPAEVVHHEDGSVSVGGKLVDDPSAYKGKPITGGIIDQLTKHAERNKKLREQEERAERDRSERDG
jgi:hypothetical protein